MSKIKIEYYSDVGCKETAIEKLANTMVYIEALLVALIIVFIGVVLAFYGFISGGLVTEFAILFVIVIICLAVASFIIATFLFMIDDDHTGKVNNYIAPIVIEIILKRNIIEGKRIC